MAEAVNVARSTITKYESGNTEAPYGTLMRLARYFDVNPDYLLGWTSSFRKDMSEERFLEILKAHGREIYKDLMN